MFESITRKFDRAGMDMDGITVVSTRELEVVRFDSDGDVDVMETAALAHAVGELLGWGGFRCGHGGWVLQKDYQSRGDFMDASSPHHY